MIKPALPFFFLLAAAATAQPRVFKVDPMGSEVSFELGATLHSVKGIFKVQNGSIDFDAAASKISGIVIVSAGTGDTGDDGRDDKMKKEVLDVSRFTEISFAPASFTGTLAPAGDSSIQVSGKFTLHGTPHDLTVPMQVHIEGSRLTAKTTFSVPFVKWGLKDPSNFMIKVKKEVEVHLTLTGVVIQPL
jgi:polyisoprenoid-binding protein YceI